MKVGVCDEETTNLTIFKYAEFDLVEDVSNYFALQYGFVR